MLFNQFSEHRTPFAVQYITLSQHQASIQSAPTGLDNPAGIIYDTIVNIVMDTNVLLAALRSSRGASHRLLLSVGTGRFELALSVPLVLEYEEVTLRYHTELGLSKTDVKDILDYLCAVAVRQRVYYLWRPFLPDPKDDMLLEVAVAAACQAIVTFNLKDFAGIGEFGIQAIQPKQFLEHIGALS